jgi:hypothetical protein
MGLIEVVAREYGEPREVNPIVGGLMLLVVAYVAFHLHKQFAAKDTGKAPRLHKAAVLTQKIGVGFFALLGMIAIVRGLFEIIFN